MSPTVLIEPSPALPLVSVLVSLRSGSSHDPAGKEGLARLTARMLRRGSERMSSQQIEETVDALGGEFAADTIVSATSIHFEVIKRNLDPFIDLIAEVIARPAFPEDELARLVRESEAEIIEARDSDRSLASRNFRRVLFTGHPYGRRNIGTFASLPTITRADVQAFHAKHYGRDNAIVAISGDVTPAEGHAIAERVLARLPAGQRMADGVGEPEGPKGRHLVFVDKPDRTQTQMVIGGLGTHTHDDDHTALAVANTAFGGTFTSRLMQEIRVKRGWSYGASSRIGFDRHRDAFTIWSAPAATDAPACLALELELLSALREGGLTRAEVDFVKGFLVRSHAFEIDTARKRVHQRMEEELYELPKGYFDGYLAAVERVDEAAATQAVRRRLSAENLVVGVVGTYAEIGSAIEASIPGLAGVTVVPFDKD